MTAVDIEDLLARFDCECDIDQTDHLSEQGECLWCHLSFPWSTLDRSEAHDVLDEHACTCEEGEYCPCLWCTLRAAFGLDDEDDLTEEEEES